ncbi:MAG: 4-(cytidine 5'-diphospho)-2-C-methyl-D-erythritol kinase [Candidatus Bruticola sp.]
MQEETTLTYLAAAKINLTLELLDTLPGGYHQLDTIFQSLELADQLFLTKAKETSLEIVDKIGCGFAVSADRNNLVIKAQQALQTLTGQELPCHFVLHKYIPAGGGLGGGSADCAATLKGLNELYNLGLSKDQLLKAADSLGADVAFGLVGNTARGLNKGEQLTSLPTPKLFKDWGVLLLVPPFGMSTPEVYKAWDCLPNDNRNPARNSSVNLTELLNNQPELYSSDSDLWQVRFLNELKNDLYPAAKYLRPELESIRNALLSWGCQAAQLCGSGSTVFAMLNPKIYRQVTDNPELLNSLNNLGHLYLTCFSQRDHYE